MLHQPPHTCRGSSSLLGSLAGLAKGVAMGRGSQGKREREKGEGEVSRAAGSDPAKTVSEWNREGLV